MNHVLNQVIHVNNIVTSWNMFPECVKKSKNLTPKINTFDMVVSNIKDMNYLTSGGSGSKNIEKKIFSFEWNRAVLIKENNDLSNLPYHWVHQEIIDSSYFCSIPQLYLAKYLSEETSKKWKFDRFQSQCFKMWFETTLRRVGLQGYLRSLCNNFENNLKQSWESNYSRNPIPTLWTQQIWN